MCTGPSSDFTFSILNAVTMGIFFAEIGGLVWTKRDYFKSFYFYLDVISTLSMVFDIRWIAMHLNDTGDASTAARTGRLSKASKGGRVVRIARLVRLVRIVKLFKIRKNVGGGRDEEDEEDEANEAIATRAPSKVARKLTEHAPPARLTLRNRERKRV